MKRILLFVSVIGLFFSGCYPGGPEFIEDYDIVLTNYSKSFNYSTVQTYALPDSIVKIGSEGILDPDGNDSPEFVNPVYADQVLASIRSNMNSRGWVEVDESMDPDVILLPATMTTENVYYYYDWWYWGWYYPGYYPGWGWYYPGYYPPAYSTGFTSGSLVIQMTYPDGKDFADQIPNLWTCVINGVAEGSNQDKLNRVVKSIDKAFEQSPYLTK